MDRDRVDPELLEASGPTGVRDALEELQAMAELHTFEVLVFGPLRDDIRAILQQLGLDYVDTYRAIPAGSMPKKEYVHAMHPRAGGHRRLAEVLEEALRQRGWLD